jgi:hypothetical protein
MSRYSDDGPGPFLIAMLLVGVVFVVGVTAWGIHACTIADEATLGRTEQRVRTQNFEESEAYRQGLRRDFDELMLSYSHAKSDDERATILAVMRHRAEGAPPDLVPQDVKDLLAKTATKDGGTP